MTKVLGFPFVLITWAFVWLTVVFLIYIHTYIVKYIFTHIFHIYICKMHEYE